MICPHCGQFIENSLHKALKGIQTYPPISITNVDYVLEVGNKITAIIEEKHCKRHIGKTFQLITLKRIAKAVNAPLLVVFVNDQAEDVTVYELDLTKKLPATTFYSFENHDPIFIGDFVEFRAWILENLVYAPILGQNNGLRRW